jgi:hypothetical protein
VLALGVILLLPISLGTAVGAASPVPVAGTWARVASPNLPATNNGLSSVACPSDSDCWGVGYSSNEQGTAASTLIENWNGTDWSIVPSPNVAGEPFSALHSVTCISMDDCWAVGVASTPGTLSSVALIENWNGTDWSIVPSPRIANDFLGAVTCLSASNCWAVGSDATNSPTPFAQPLVEQWDGTQWSTVSAPNFVVDGHSVPTPLVGIACPSENDCWAVGNAGIGVPPNVSFRTPIFEHWNGSTWSIDSSGTNASLTGVTCVNGSDCWAVGSQFTGANGATQTLTERWNGTAWSTVDSANSGTSVDNGLSGVTCLSESNCWVVGTVELASSAATTLSEQWNGTSWSIVPSANGSSKDDSALGSVACADASDCWSVGGAGLASSRKPKGQTLVEWLVPPTTISITPTTGPPGTAVTISGSGYQFDKPVKASYETGLTGPKATLKLHCGAPTAANGSFHCTVTLPTRNTGALGPHVMTAFDRDFTASTTFTLT